MADFKTSIALAASGKPLTREQAQHAFDAMMSGAATPGQIGGFLMALRVRGETVDEIAGAVSTMRAKMVPVDAPANAIDIVGTGGDQSGSYNVSTCAAIVAAAAGATVAKHGNRALSSKSGAADTLEALGVSLDPNPERIAQCIRDAGVGFMFAPNHHAAMRYVGPTRVELGTRTVFNLLGPLSNPASVSRQLVGVFSPEWVEPLAHVLKELGSEAAWVVHGDGMDEITVTGSTMVSELKDGVVRSFKIIPEDAGVDTHSMDALKGGDANANAKALLEVLDGEHGAYRDIVLMNAGAGLLVAGIAATLSQGAKLAADAIDTGAAKDRLAKLVAVSNGEGGAA
ncbi:MAG: anthranilate phosphoribosyltransferase [Pseudomonadota bacterium]